MLTNDNVCASDIQLEKLIQTEIIFKIKHVNFLLKYSFDIYIEWYFVHIKQKIRISLKDQNYLKYNAFQP